MPASIDPIAGRHRALSDLTAALDRVIFLLETIKSSIVYMSHLPDAVDKSTHFRASQHIELAIEMSERLGAPGLLLPADDQPGNTLSNSGNEPSASVGLTNREQEVIKLVATGLSNAHIAEELFISTNTVARHVGGIFAKTESENRVQAANYAREHGLLE